MQKQNKTTKRVTVVVSNNGQKKNKSRSKVPKRNSSSPLGQMRSAPIARTTQTSQMNNNFKSFRLPRRREMLSSILSSNAEFFHSQTVILNPGDPSFSTWLANQALCYESYKFHHLKFIYIPRCPSTTTGDVFLCPDSNPKDPVPVTEVEASQNERTKSSSPWDHFDITLPKEMLNKRKTYFCRKQGAVPAGADIDLYDTGNLFILLGGQAASNSKIGQLWVEYDVEFFTPEGTPILGQPTTVFGKSTAGLTINNPIAGSNFVSEGVGNAVNINALDGKITALRDFHGLLSTVFAGTGLTNVVNFNTTGGATASITEDTYNIGSTVSSGTFTTANRVVNMPQGSAIDIVLGAATTLTSSAISLTNCYL